MEEEPCTASDILDGMCTEIECNLLPSLCHVCKPITSRYIASYKLKGTQQLQREKHATAIKKHFGATGLNEEPGVLSIGPQGTLRQFANNAKLGDLHTRQRKIKLAGEKQLQETGRTSGVLLKNEEEQENFRTQSEVFDEFDKHVTINLFPSLCYGCNAIVINYITEEKCKLNVKLSGLNEEQKNSYMHTYQLSRHKKYENAGKLEDILIAKWKLESIVGFLSSELGEANDLKRKSVLKCQEMESSLKTLEKYSAELRTENCVLQREKDELKKEVNEFLIGKAKVSLLSSHLQEANHLKRKSDLKCEEMESSLQTLEKQSEKAKENSAKLQREKDELQKENDEMKKKLQLLELELRAANTHLSAKESDWDKQLQSEKLENTELIVRLETLENSHSQLKKEITEKQKRIHDLSTSSNQKERELVSRLHDAEKGCRALQNILDSKEIELAEPKKPKQALVIGVRSLGSGLTPTISNMIVAELSRLIRGSFKNDNVELEIKQCTTSIDIPNGPLIVLCLSQTSIGSNVKEALGGIEVSKTWWFLYYIMVEKKTQSPSTLQSIVLVEVSLKSETYWT